MTEPKDFLEKLEKNIELADKEHARIRTFSIEADELRHLVKIARAAIKRHQVVYSHEAHVALDAALRNANLLREEDPNA